MTTKTKLCLQNPPKIIYLIFCCLTARVKVCIHLENFISNYVLTGCKKCLFIMGFIVFVSSCRDTASQYGEGCNISVTRLRYSANHNTLHSWPIRACLTSQNDELCNANNSPSLLIISSVQCSKPFVMMSKG